MRIVFFGSSQFSVPSLKALADARYDIAAVVTPPDKKAGRGLKIRPTEVKEFSLERGFFVLQPSHPNKDKNFLKNLKELKADVFAVVAYGHILSGEIIDMPHFFTINLHPSLLPKYRGSAPINWVLINGDEKTGVSIIKVIKQMDAGPVIYQQEEKIFKDDTAVSLGQRLAEKGAEALVKAVSLIETGKIIFISQNEEVVTFAPKLKKEDALINFKLPAHVLYNKIRGMAGWPTAFTFFKNKRVELLETDYEKIKTECFPSVIVDISKENIKVAAGEEILVIKKVKPEGKKEMPAADFARGCRLKKGDKVV
ncbi:MAG: methionyl-tRNA formyltransferase [Candidatus Omnitrophota bacterium]